MSNEELKPYAPEIYVWFADNKGTERDGEQFIRAWTPDKSRADGLRNAIGREPVIYRASDAAQAPTAWVRFRSDGGFEGPIMDSDSRMCDTRRSFWTPLFAGCAAIAPSDAAQAPRDTWELIREINGGGAEPIASPLWTVNDALRAIIHARDAGQDAVLILDENSPLVDAARAALSAPLAAQAPHDKPTPLDDETVSVIRSFVDRPGETYRGCITNRLGIGFGRALRRAIEESRVAPQAAGDAAQRAQISFDQPALPSPDAQCEAQYGGQVITYHSDEQIIRYAEECVAAAIAAHTSRAAPVPPAAAAPSDEPRGYSKGTDQVWFANRNRTCQETTPEECNNCQSDSPYALCTQTAQPEICSMCEQQYDPACEECHTGSADAAQPDERAAFEVFAREEFSDGGDDPCKRGQCGYVDPSVDFAWIGWQARATASQGDKQS